MKILFVMPTAISYGGIESATISLWKYLIKKNHEIDFVCHGNVEGVFEKEIINNGSHVYHIPVKGKNIIGCKNKFKKILKTNNYDVVHANMNATCGLYLKWAKKLGVKVLVAHSHASSMKVFTNNSIKAWINEKEKNRTDKYANIKLACSDSAGKWLYKFNDYIVVPNSVDAKTFIYNADLRKCVRNKMDIEDDCKFFLNVGRLDVNKNQNFLIEVINYMVNKKNIKCKLILIGDGYNKHNLEEKVCKYKLEDKIIFLGERNDVYAYLQAADCFVLSSYSEGNPVSLAEAIVSGVHCVVADTISKTVLNFSDSNQIDYMSVSSDDSKFKWCDKLNQDYKRIIYSEDKPCKLSNDYIGPIIEKLYLNTKVKNEQ